jgi:hypothetical protein
MWSALGKKGTPYTAIATWNGPGSKPPHYAILIRGLFLPAREGSVSGGVQMRSHWTRTARAILVVASWLPAAAQQSPPTTRVANFRESFHGAELTDSYHWLENSASPETRQWIDAQNSYARSLLDPLPMRKEIKQRLTEMLRHDQIDAPSQRNGYYYFSKHGEEQDLWSFYRRKMAGGADELLLDSNTLSREHTTSI